MSAWLAGRLAGWVAAVEYLPADQPVIRWPSFMTKSGLYVSFLVLGCVTITPPEVLWLERAKSYASDQKKQVDIALYTGKANLFDEKRPEMGLANLQAIKDWQEKYKHLVRDEAVVDPKIAARLLVCVAMSSMTKQGVKGRKKWDLNLPPSKNISAGLEAWMWTYLWIQHSYHIIETTQGV
jgi:hypothetical protein